jgi:hypothetical protein
MSFVTYNGVALPYPFHTQFSQEPVYDEVGQTDQTLMRYNIRVNTIVHADYLPMLAPELINNAGAKATLNPAMIMAVVRNNLRQPRKTLSVICNGEELIPQRQRGDETTTVDARNGPLPQTVDIQQLTNESFLVTFHVIAHYYERIDVNPEVVEDGDGNPIPHVLNLPGNTVIYNRWTESVDLDRCMFSTRTREGTFAIRSDNFEGLTADLLRPRMGVLGVPPGFRRDSAHYTARPDGLAIGYRIVDKELFKMPPSPAYEADGDYSMSTTNHGAQCWGDAWCRLKGAKTTPQHLLIIVAVAVVATKLRVGSGILFAGQVAVPTFLEQFSVQVGLYENWVMVRGRARYGARKKGRVNGIFGMDWNAMAISPFTTGSIPAQGAPTEWLHRGTAGILLQAAAYYDPSLIGTQITQATGNLSAGLQPGARPANNQ